MNSGKLIIATVFLIWLGITLYRYWLGQKMRREALAQDENALVFKNVFMVWHTYSKFRYQFTMEKSDIIFSKKSLYLVSGRFNLYLFFNFSPTQIVLTIKDIEVKSLSNKLVNLKFDQSSIHIPLAFFFLSSYKFTCECTFQTAEDRDKFLEKFNEI